MKYAIALFLLVLEMVSASTVFWKQRDGTVAWDVLPLLERAYPVESQRAHHARISWMPLVKHVRGMYLKRIGAYASWPPTAIGALVQHGGMLPWIMDNNAPCPITWVHSRMPFLWGLVDAPEVCWLRSDNVSETFFEIHISNATFTMTRHAILVHHIHDAPHPTRGWNVAWPPEWDCLPPIRSSWDDAPLQWCLSSKNDSSYASLCRGNVAIQAPDAWRTEGIFAFWDGRMHRIVAPEDIIWDPDLERSAQRCLSRPASTSNLTLLWSLARDYTTQHARMDDHHALLFESDTDGVDGWRLALSIIVTLIMSARLFHPSYDLLPHTRRVRIHRAYLFIDGICIWIAVIALVWYWIQVSYPSADVLWWMIAWASCFISTASWILLTERAFYSQRRLWWKYVLARTCMPWWTSSERTRRFTSSLKPVYVHGAWVYLHQWIITTILAAAVLWGVLQWSLATLFEECILVAVLILYHSYTLHNLVLFSQRFGWWPRIVLVLNIAWTWRDTLVWILPCVRTLNVVYDDDEVVALFLCLWAAVFAVTLPPPLTSFSSPAAAVEPKSFDRLVGALLDEVW